MTLVTDAPRVEAWIYILIGEHLETTKRPPAAACLLINFKFRLSCMINAAVVATVRTAPLQHADILHMDRTVEGNSVCICRAAVGAHL